jgi:serine/threonine-protein kinase HipA
MNPDPHSAGLKLNISETDNAQDVDLALSVASVYRVKKERAEAIVTEVTDAVNQWRLVAKSLGLPRTAQDRMRRAFRVAEARSRSAASQKKRVRPAR